MATYRSIAASETDANSPVTQTLMEALAENPTAIAEGASGAPKIAISQSSGIAAASSSLTFSGLDDFGGIMIHGSFRASAGGPDTLTFSISTDGVTFTDSTTVISSAAFSGNNGSPYHLSFMFDDGALECVYIDVAPERVATTLSGSSLAVTHVRLTTGSDMSITAMALPNGGRSTT